MTRDGRRWVNCEDCKKQDYCTKAVGIIFGGCAVDNVPLQLGTSSGECGHHCRWCKYGAECKWPGKFEHGCEERSGDNA